MSRIPQKSYMYGAASAILDMRELRIRTEKATAEELASWWWRLKFKLRTLWLGFTAPPRNTPAGKGYRDWMKGDAA